MHLVVFQQVNQFPKLAIVSAIRNRFLIRREFFLASPAERRLVPGIALCQTFAATFTGWSCDWNDGCDAGFADRQARDVR
jgi:hypothetical protein